MHACLRLFSLALDRHCTVRTVHLARVCGLGWEGRLGLGKKGLGVVIGGSSGVESGL